MPIWTEPQYTRSEVKRAGKELRQSLIPLNTDIIKNWRSAHSYPLNLFYIDLKRRARGANPNCVVSQRLKRISSIHAKLVREPSMQLTTMQDIAGCRAILPAQKDVYQLVRSILSSGIQHEFDHVKDYIAEPKKSGYRSYHLVYRFKSATKTAYEDMRVEMQLRTGLQHAWATALETIDFFTRQALKSSQGLQDWERFFVLMGSALAAKERSPLVPGTPSGKLLKEEICHLNEQLLVIQKLKSYKTFRSILGFDQMKKHSYVLLRTVVEEGRGQIRVWGFGEGDLDKAQNLYYAEESKRNGEVVLEAVIDFVPFE